MTIATMDGRKLSLRVLMSGDEGRLGYEYLAALKESDLSTHPQIQIGAAGNDASLLCSRWGMNMLCCSLT
jgi:hypothetical protein